MIELTRELLLLKHINEVKAHTSRSKKGKTFNVRQYDRKRRKEMNRKEKRLSQMYFGGMSHFSVYHTKAGGMGQKRALQALKAHGIKGRKAHSPYVDQQGVEVPFKNRKKAGRILYGR